MTEYMNKLSRIAVAIGGILIMMAIFLMTTIALTLSDIIDVSALANETYLFVFMLALLSIGAFDIIAGIMLSRG